MTVENEPRVVADDVVVSLDYVLRVNGEEVDSSNEGEPIDFLQGYGNIIPGLEKELYGMAVGDSKSVQVAARDGYGESDPEAIIEVPRSEFPEDVPLKPGLELQMQNVDGDMLNAVVVDISDETVRLDFNHPLAGQELHFDVTVISLRAATDEELAHGHVHSHEHEDEYEEEGDLDELEYEGGDDDDLLFTDEEEDNLY